MIVCYGLISYYVLQYLLHAQPINRLTLWSWTVTDQHDNLNLSIFMIYYVDEIL